MGGNSFKPERVMDKPEEPKCCELLQIKKDVYAHQQSCKDYQAGEDADKLRKALKGVELGWWSDTVLEKHPKRQILNMTKKGISKGHIWKDPKYVDLPDDHPFKEYENSVVVEWVLPGVTLLLARGHTINPMTRKPMSVYAVQEIKKNDKRKRKVKPKFRR